VLMFATHGLLGGSVTGPGEPALVVTRDSDDDGLLRMSDVVSRDLRADLVILSACATAPSGDDGAEPLAGLASAFLIAGARTVVASHWRVATNMAETLTTGMLAEMREKKLSPGLALRASARAVRADPDFAHPVFWAPFEVIGLPSAR
jgi:CHAT domain-containing protein